MEGIESVDISEIEVTPEMIEAGTLEFCSFDCRFEPQEAAVVRVFQKMVSLSTLGASRVVLASEAASSLSPYLEKTEETAHS